MARKVLDVVYQSQHNNPHNPSLGFFNSERKKTGCAKANPSGNGALHDGPGSEGCKGVWWTPGTTEGAPVEERAYCVRGSTCNVTSLYMALRFLGLDQKPDPQPDTKEAKSRKTKLGKGGGENQWDVRHGWLPDGPMSATWIAVWIHTYFNTDVTNSDSLVKYARVVIAKYPGRVKAVKKPSNGWDWNLYKQCIDSGSPAVLSIPHHFVLGIGYDDDGQKAIVHDPAYKGEAAGGIWKGVAYNACGAGLESRLVKVNGRKSYVDGGTEGKLAGVTGRSNERPWRDIQLPNEGGNSGRGIVVYFEIDGAAPVTPSPRAPDPISVPPPPRPAPVTGKLTSKILSASATLQGLSGDQRFAAKTESWSDRAAVRPLQQALKKVGSGSLHIDGIWGAKTTEALVHFQTNKIPDLRTRIPGWADVDKPGELDFTTLIGLDLATVDAEGGGAS